MKKPLGWITATALTATLSLGIGALGPTLQTTPTGPAATHDTATHDAAADHAATSAQATAEQATAEQANLRPDPCRDLTAEIRRFFDAPPSPLSPPCPADQDFATTSLLQLPAQQMHFAIAILPDPLHTHFSLTFDRYTQAIQQAAQDEGFYYDSSWMPWNTDEPAYSRLGDRLEADRQTEDREDQPGLILFRRTDAPGSPGNGTARAYGEGLAVFVVGEEATAGVHRRQFTNSLAWIERLQGAGPQPHPLTIIGPSFSGSLASLAQLLEHRWPAPAPMDVRIFSGAITRKAAVKDFAAIFSSRAVSFQSFEQNDEEQIKNYCRYLRDAGMTDMSHVAVISEDETRYGDLDEPAAAGGGLCDSLASMHLTKLFYPRDISALRAAYQSQSLFSPGAGAAGGDVTRRVLKTDLADPEGHQHDTIRSYSGTQTALSQESELQQIVRMLQAHASQYIILRSSNPLDEVFLASYLQQQYPQGRIVVASADLLLARDLQANGITGILTLSNYPLLPSEEDWTSTPSAADGRQPSHMHRAFTNSEAEGTYVATRASIRNPAHESAPCPGAGVFAPPLREIAGNSRQSLRDYANPFWLPAHPQGAQDTGCHSPPTWIAVLARGGFWPVASMAPEDAGCSRCDLLKSLLFWPGSPSRRDVPDLPARGLAVPLSFTVTLLAAFSWSVFHLLCCGSPTLTRKPGFFAHFAGAPFSPRHARSHLALLVTGSVLVGIVPGILGWGMGTHSADAGISIAPFGFRVLLALTWVCGLLSIASNIWIEARLQEVAALQPPGTAPIGVIECIWPSALSFRQWMAAIWHKVRKPCLAYVAATFGVHTLLILALEPRLHDYNRVSTYIRSMNINSGVSPVTPLLILLAGLYGWFWFTLQGQAVLGEDRPRLPRLRTLAVRIQTGGPALDLLTMLSREHMARSVESWCGWVSRKTGAAFGIAFVTVLALASIVQGEFPPLRSLGSREYSSLCFAVLAFCAALLLTNAWQMLRIWFSLRQLLTTLDRLPLRRTVRALRGFSWGSIWSMGGNVLEERYKLYSRQVECLNHMQTLLGRPGATCGPTEASRDDGTCIQHLQDLERPQLEFWTWYARHWNDWGARDLLSIQNTVQQRFAAFSGYLLTTVLLPAWKTEPDSLIADFAKEESRGEHFSMEHVEAHVGTAEEFVCLVYLGFVQNVLGRIRSLISGMTVLFVALALGITSYPFDPRPQLSSFIVLLFLLLGSIVFVVYAGMFRDATLSRLTNSKPGELGGEFWLKVLGIGIGPVFSLMASLFPAFANFFFSWLQPGMSSLK